MACADDWDGDRRERSGLKARRRAWHAAVSVDTFLLAMAMAALGLTTRWSAIRIVGIKPLALAGLLFCWLLAGGLVINTGVTALLR